MPRFDVGSNHIEFRASRISPIPRRLAFLRISSFSEISLLRRAELAGAQIQHTKRLIPDVECESREFAVRVDATNNFVQSVTSL